MMNKIFWQELFKIRIASSNENFQKHEVVKLLLVMKLIEKNKRDKNFLRIYTEFELDNNLKCDVYFENARSKEAFAYEIQKDYSKEWLETKTKEYKEWNVPFMSTSDWIPINLNECPDNIKEINEWLNQFIF